MTDEVKREDIYSYDKYGNIKGINIVDSNNGRRVERDFREGARITETKDNEGKITDIRIVNPEGRLREEKIHLNEDGSYEKTSLSIRGHVEELNYHHSNNGRSFEFLTPRTDVLNMGKLAWCAASYTKEGKREYCVAALNDGSRAFFDCETKGLSEYGELRKPKGPEEEQQLNSYIQKAAKEAKEHKDYLFDGKSSIEAKIERDKLNFEMFSDRVEKIRGFDIGKSKVREEEIKKAVETGEGFSEVELTDKNNTVKVTKLDVNNDTKGGKFVETKVSSEKETKKGKTKEENTTTETYDDGQYIKRETNDSFSTNKDGTETTLSHSRHYSLGVDPTDTVEDYGHPDLAIQEGLTRGSSVIEHTKKDKDGNEIYHKLESNYDVDGLQIRKETLKKGGEEYEAIYHAPSGFTDANYMGKLKIKKKDSEGGKFVATEDGYSSYTDKNGKGHRISNDAGGFLFGKGYGDHKLGMSYESYDPQTGEGHYITSDDTKDLIEGQVHDIEIFKKENVYEFERERERQKTPNGYSNIKTTYTYWDAQKDEACQLVQEGDKMTYNSWNAKGEYVYTKDNKIVENWHKFDKVDTNEIMRNDAKKAQEYFKEITEGKAKNFGEYMAVAGRDLIEQGKEHPRSSWQTASMKGAHNDMGTDRTPSEIQEKIKASQSKKQEQRYKEQQNIDINAVAKKKLQEKSR